MTKGIVCSSLYTVDESRSKKGNTQAVKELTHNAIDEGLDITTVLRVKPLLSKGGLFKYSQTEYEGVRIYDIPLFGFSFFYSSKLTRFLIRFFKVKIDTSFAVCHYARNVIFIKDFFPEIKSIIYVIHNTDFKFQNNHLTKLALAKSDCVLVRSEALKIRLLNEFKSIADGVLFSGLSPLDYKKSFQENIYLDGNVKIIVACNLIELKNVQSIIESVSKLNKSGYKVELKIFGDGPLKNSLANIVKKLNLSKQVYFMGFKDRITVLKHMRLSNLFIMPSAPETFGLAFLEAMASGCVVIGHKGWGIDGVVDDGVNGFLVDKASPVDIVEKIVAYLNGDKEEIHKRSYSTALNYTKEKASRNYIYYINKTIEKRSVDEA